MANHNEMAQDFLENLDSTHLLLLDQNDPQNAYLAGYVMGRKVLGDLLDAFQTMAQDFGDTLNQWARSVHDTIVSIIDFEQTIKILETLRRFHIAACLRRFRLGWLAWRLPIWVIWHWPEKWLRGEEKNE